MEELSFYIQLFRRVLEEYLKCKINKQKELCIEDEMRVSCKF